MRYQITVDTGDTRLEEWDTKNLWDTVAHFYPHYSQSDEIYYNDKMQMIVDGEEENSEGAMKILAEDFEGDREAVNVALLISNENIYDKTLTEFLSRIVSVERVNE